jgi:hypothetical protein
MLRHLALTLLVPATLATASAAAPAPSTRAAVPSADHVFVVIMENRSLGDVRFQPYTASLMNAYCWFAQSFAMGYPSQPNYFALFSGSTQGITTDACPAFGSPFSTTNLGQAVEAAGKTWRSYSENLAYPGATDCSFDGDAITGLYTRKHSPWSYFTNLDHQNERPYTDLATDLANGTVPNLAFIVPNNCHNSHDLSSDPACSVANADVWLSQNLPPILNQMGPRDLLILTWDEDAHNAGNNVLTVFAGPMVVPHSASINFVNHVTVCRTIADLLGVTPPGNSGNTFPIGGVWDFATAARSQGWGRLKQMYR